MAETVTIPSRLEAIDDARRFVTARMRAAAVGEDAVGEFELALTEALANVIEHSYAGDPSREIVVEVDITEELLAVHVRDWGRAFDLGGYAPRDLDDPGEGGYGVFLIEELMDSVTRETQPNGGTLLTLIKQRKEGQSHG